MKNDDVARAARRLLQPLLDARIEAVGKLAAAAGEVENAEAALAAARQRTSRARANYQDLRREAVGAGWNNPQLESLGLPAQFARPISQRRRPASPTRTAPRPSETDESAGGEPTAGPVIANQPRVVPVAESRVDDRTTAADAGTAPA